MFLESLVLQSAVSLIIGLTRFGPAKMDEIKGFRRIRYLYGRFCLPLRGVLMLLRYRWLKGPSGRSLLTSEQDGFFGEDGDGVLGVARVSLKSLRLCASA